MILTFSKFHGTGNDFIIIDQRINKVKLSKKNILLLCDRHIGIGADGLMLIQNHNLLDFSMQYFNADGQEGSMCGNGGRCITAYFYSKIARKSIIHFMAVDGEHVGKVLSAKDSHAKVSLKLNDVSNIKKGSNYYILDTGSPHFVRFVRDADRIDVKAKGKQIRNNKNYAEEGLNVNFVELQSDKLYVRTYERGVENETLSCGTGVTAAAIAAATFTNQYGFDVKTKGGNLRVEFKKNTEKYTDVWLTGDAVEVFNGEIVL